MQADVDGLNPYEPPTTETIARRSLVLSFFVTGLLGLLGIFFCAIMGAFIGMGVVIFLNPVVPVDASDAVESLGRRGSAIGFWLCAALGVVRVVVLMYHKVRRDSVREAEAEEEV